MENVWGIGCINSMDAWITWYTDRHRRAIHSFYSAFTRLWHFPFLFTFRSDNETVFHVLMHFVENSNWGNGIIRRVPDASTDGGSPMPRNHTRTFQIFRTKRMRFSTLFHFSSRSFLPSCWWRLCRRPHAEFVLILLSAHLHALRWPLHILHSHVNLHSHIRNTYFISSTQSFSKLFWRRWYCHRTSLRLCAVAVAEG